MALCCSGCSYRPQSGLQIRQLGNVSCGLIQGRFRSSSNLQICGSLRRGASLPLKKNQQSGNLLEELEEEIKPFLELRLLRESRQRTMRHYEIMYLVHEAKVDQLQEIISKFTDFVEEKKGRLFRLNDWGMRRMAYRIEKTWRANYILMNIQIAPEFINELNSMMERDPRVIRHMIMTKKKGETETTVPPEDLPPSRAELLEAEFAAEDEAEAAANKEAAEAKAAERRARKEAALAQKNVNVHELEASDEDDDELQGDEDEDELQDEDENEDEDEDEVDEEDEDTFDSQEDQTEEDEDDSGDYEVKRKK